MEGFCFLQERNPGSWVSSYWETWGILADGLRCSGRVSPTPDPHPNPHREPLLSWGWGRTPPGRNVPPREAQLPLQGPPVEVGPRAGGSQGERKALRDQGRGAEANGQGREEGRVPDGPWTGGARAAQPTNRSSPQDLPEASGKPRAPPAQSCRSEPEFLDADNSPAPPPPRPSTALTARQFTCSPATSLFHGTHRSWGHRSVTARAFHGNSAGKPATGRPQVTGDL